MHTQKRFFQLSKNAGVNKAGGGELGALSVQLNVAQLARIQALAERLNISREQIVQELLDCALGDAHDGFLSAFSTPSQREKENLQLKQRVNALKKSKADVL